MTTTTTTAQHPWEARFGAPPYRYVTSTRKVHSTRGVEADGSLGWSFGKDTEKPGGTCDVCGTPIMYCHVLRSSTGVEFVVGSDCVLKADSGVTHSDIAKMATVDREAKRAAQADRARARTMQQFPDLPALLRDNVPDDWLAGKVAAMRGDLARTGKLSEKQVAWLRRMPRDYA
jgi:hypothetical protein